jgi:hypothetical protein
VNKKNRKGFTSCEVTKYDLINRGIHGSYQAITYGYAENTNIHSPVKHKVPT